MYAGLIGTVEGGPPQPLLTPDPDNHLAGGYVMNKMATGISGDPRSTSLIRASYDCAGAPCKYA